MRITTQYIARVGFLSSSISTIRSHTAYHHLLNLISDEPQLPFKFWRGITDETKAKGCFAPELCQYQATEPPALRRFPSVRTDICCLITYLSRLRTILVLHYVL